MTRSWNRLLRTFSRLAHIHFRPSTPGEPSDQRRWNRAALIGLIGAAPIQLWMITAGSWNLLRWERVGDFFDAQARGLLEGALAMDPFVLGIEAFFRRGNAYMYFGPLPAVFRIPVVALTDRYEGRLAGISFVAALMLLFLVVRSLGWRFRWHMCGAMRVSRFEQLSVALVFASIFAGSVLIFLSSRTWVYHEASIWGIALTLAALNSLFIWIDARSVERLVKTSLWATAAMSTRVSVGAGALAGLMLAAVFIILERRNDDSAGTHHDGSTNGANRRDAVRCVLACLPPLMAYASVNFIRFGTFFSVPFANQAFTRLDPARQQMLEAAGGSLFNLRYIPSNLVQYLRPDMLGLSQRWPWIGFSTRRPWTSTSPPYDLVDLTAGIPAVMPVLVILTAFACTAAVRGGKDAMAQRILLASGAVSTLSVLAIGYMANRYQGDFMPLLIVGSMAGLAAVTRYLDAHVAMIRRAVCLALAVAVAFSIAANTSLAYFFQRAYGPGTSPQQLAGYVSTQLDVADVFGDRPTVTRGTRVPDSGNLGDLFILGDCQALYWSDGMLTNAVKRSNWNLVETADGQTGFAARVRLESPTRGTVQPLLSLDGPAGPTTVFIVLGPGSSALRIGYWGPDGDVLGAPIPVSFTSSMHLEVIADRNVRLLEVRLEGRVGLSADYSGGASVTFGTDPLGLEFIDSPLLGEIEVVNRPTPVCNRLLNGG